MDLVSLNEDILKTIIVQVKHKSLRHLPLVCRTFLKIIDNQDFWRRKMEFCLQKTFLPTPESPRDWKRIYLGQAGGDLKFDPLLEAAKRGWIDLAEAILEKFKRLKSYKKILHTVLVRASLFGQSGIVGLCIVNGVFVNPADSERTSGDDAVIPDTEYETDISWRYCSPKCHIEEYEDMYSCALSAACHNSLPGSAEIIDILLKAGATPNRCRNEPFLVAIWQGRMDIVQHFFEKGFTIKGETEVLMSNSICDAALHPLHDGNKSVRDFLLSHFSNLPEEIFIVICTLTMLSEEYELLKTLSRRPETKRYAVTYANQLCLSLISACKKVEMLLQVLSIYKEYIDADLVTEAIINLLQTKGSSKEIICHLLLLFNLNGGQIKMILLNMIEYGYDDLLWPTLGDHQDFDKKFLEEILTALINPLRVRGRSKLIKNIVAKKSGSLTGSALGAVLINIARDLFLYDNLTLGDQEDFWLGYSNNLINLVLSPQWSIPNHYLLVAVRIYPNLRRRLIRYAPHLRKRLDNI